VSRGTLELSHFALLFDYGAVTLYGLPFQVVRLSLTKIMLVLNPGIVNYSGLGSSPFARRYLGNLT
jgi:hypothetical protein